LLKPPRRASSALIALFLVYQLAMPLRYYIGGRGDDERFAWRMFSSLSLRRCTPAVQEIVLDNGVEEPRPLQLGAVLHARWVGILERYHPRMVRKFLQSRCIQPDVTAVRYELTCTDVDGSALPPVEVTLPCDPPSPIRLP
jgi:hypothetical protein